MKLFLKKIFNLSLIIKVRNFFNLRPLNIDKTKLNIFIIKNCKKNYY